MTLFDAIHERDAALAQVAENAGQDFIRRARDFVLDYLARHGPTPGEVLVNQAKADGLVPHSDKAFGAVLAGLSRRKRIAKDGYCERAKGHGTAGGIVWKLA